ncbi:MCE family protein [Mycobacterium sp. CBMA271]|uniref:MlaD family protein n=1 Tax=unclassified Mycobacteroides TaxID=2618759 RepID=UPI0012DC67E7|nr:MULTISPECIES: MlaD family protein [unclassified Mycobacteroides]MUM19183.1 mammalian cell entry protein [Mycobacteroides sp. CBMA 326]MUM21597.1 MCE family protein [Mycobacteroides sp. CBMA 271]
MTAPQTSGGLLESISRGLVALSDVFKRSWKWLSVVGLVGILVVCAGYVMFGTLKVNPIESKYQVKVQLHESGGLLPNQEVTLRGVPIGRVQSVNLEKGGVVATASIESGVKLPVSSEVRVSGLSPAGEQYLDFRPTTNDGPFLGNNSIVAMGQASTPMTLAQVLADSDGLLAQLDTEKLKVIRQEMGVSTQGADKLADIFDGGTFLITTLDGVLPETVDLLKSGRVTFSTLVDLNSGLDSTGQQLGSTFAGLKKMDGGFRTLLGRAPQTLHGVDNIFADNSDTMVQLLGNLATVAQINYVRVPALNALFPGPEVRGSTLESVSTIFHDGAIWALADLLYPRPTCDYATPRRPVSDASFYEPALYSTYCANPDPAVLVRGARNAPRPADDDTAGPPPNADLAKVSDPTPRGKWSVPTPYGGPQWPLPIPGDAPLPPEAPAPPPGFGNTPPTGR